MAHEEEQTQNTSNGIIGLGSNNIISSRSSSKKTKQKKVPQRGLGVAQLEKIRLEEQQKKAAAAAILSTTPPSSLSSPTKSTSSSCPSSVSIRHFYQPPSSIPFPSLDLPSPNSIFQPPLIRPAHSGVDGRKLMISSGTVPFGMRNSYNNNNINGCGNGNHVPNLWNPCEFNVLDHKESSNPGLDPGLAFRSNLNVPFESNNNNPIRALSNFRTRTHQFHQQHPPPPPPPPPPSSPPPSMVNVSTATSTSSVLNFQIEPPSNQSYYSNSAPMWPDEEKMVGMKRPYPFSLENPSVPSINFKFPTFVAPPIRTDEGTSCGNRSPFNFDPAINPNFREGPSWSNSISESNSRSSIKENGSVNGDFLTLAPPSTSWTCPSPKLKLPPSYLAFHNCEVPDFESFPYQGNNADDTYYQPGPSIPNPQQAFYSFFPPAKSQNGRAATTLNNNCNGEVGESVDLKLRL
ncbi:hypothetical protein ACFX2C_007768 [Malus domestica]